MVDTNLNDVLTQAGTFHPAAAAAVIRTLPKSVKEALWRENRRSGTTLERDRRMRRSRVAAPIGLPALLGLLSLPGLMVIARANEPDSARFSGGGIWLGEREIGETGKSPNVRTTNLATAIEQTYEDSGRDARSAPSTPRLVHEVFPQFHEWVNESAATLGGDITVEVTLALRNAPYALVYLPALKEYLAYSRATHLGRVAHPSARLPLYQFSTYSNRAPEAGEQLRRIASKTNRLDQGLIQAVSKDVFSCWMRAEVVDADTGN